VSKPEPEPVGARTSPPRHGVRRLLLVALIVLGIGALAAPVYGFIWYDRATRPDLSQPDLVAASYLRALLIERDDPRADLFVCDEPDLGPIRALREEIERRERDFGVTVRVSLGALTTTRIANDRETVRTDITIAGVSSGTAVRSERTETWRLDLVEDDGWRVCSATKAP